MRARNHVVGAGRCDLYRSGGTGRMDKAELKASQGLPGLQRCGEQGIDAVVLRARPWNAAASDDVFTWRRGSMFIAEEADDAYWRSVQGGGGG